MTGLLPFAADIQIGHHVQRTSHGMTFNIDTIISTLVAGVLVLLFGFWATRALTKGPPTTSRQSRRSSGSSSSARSTSRSRTTSAGCTPSSRRSRSRSSSSSCSATGSSCCHQVRGQRPRGPPAAGADGRHQPDLRARGGHHGERLGLRDEAEGCQGLLQALPRALPGPAAAEHPRGADQADHARAATLRQHLRRRHHAGADRADPALRDVGSPTSSGRPSTASSASSRPSSSRS